MAFAWGASGRPFESGRSDKTLSSGSVFFWLVLPQNNYQVLSHLPPSTKRLVSLPKVKYVFLKVRLNPKFVTFERPHKFFKYEEKTADYTNCTPGFWFDPIHQAGP